MDGFDFLPTGTLDIPDPDALQAPVNPAPRFGGGRPSLAESADPSVIRFPGGDEIFAPPVNPDPPPDGFGFIDDPTMHPCQWGGDCECGGSCRSGSGSCGGSCHGGGTSTGWGDPLDTVGIGPVGPPWGDITTADIPDGDGGGRSGGGDIQRPTDACCCCPEDITIHSTPARTPEEMKGDEEALPIVVGANGSVELQFSGWIVMNYERRLPGGNCSVSWRERYTGYEVIATDLPKDRRFRYRDFPRLAADEWHDRLAMYEESLRRIPTSEREAAPDRPERSLNKTLYPFTDLLPKANPDCMPKVRIRFGDHAVLRRQERERLAGWQSPTKKLEIEITLRGGSGCNCGRQEIKRTISTPWPGYTGQSLDDFRKGALAGHAKSPHAHE
ncbi:MAG: hypothetical protein V2J02_09570 [Pseudomonadales bacterium]|jgi:hypothetical protein|nr:hypothetical protein [Pseudomonadales bacterium]